MAEQRARSVLELGVVGDRQFFATLDQVERRTTGLGATLNRTGNSVNLTNLQNQIGGLNKPLTDVTGKVSLFDQVVAQLSRRAGSAGPLLQATLTGSIAAIGTAAISAGASLIAMGVQGIGELVRRGSQLSATRQSFIALAGGVEESNRRLEAMREGAKGLVKDSDLLLAGNKAMLLGLNMNAQQMGELTRVARTLGTAMGLETTHAVDLLTTALGRQSELKLDDLGITMSATEAYRKYAAEIGKNADQLTEAEKKQAFVNEAMRLARERADQLGDQLPTLADRWDQVATSIGNAADKMGEWLNKAITEALNPRSFDIRELSAEQRKMLEEGLKNGENMAVVMARIRGEIRDTDIELKGSSLREPFGPPEALQSYQSRLAAAREEVARLSRAQKDELNAAIQMGGDAASKYAKAIGLSETALRLYTQQLKEANKEIALHIVQQRSLVNAWAVSARGPWTSGMLPFAGNPWQQATQLMSTLPSTNLVNLSDPRLWNAGGLGMLRETVPMNPPAASPGGFMNFLQGAGGRFLGTGLGIASGLIPGMSFAGSSIGSGLGSAIGGISSVASALGSFAGFLGPIGGIVGGLVGKLFGPSEATLTRRARNEFIEEFGGLAELRRQAELAGVSLDRLFAARKREDLQREIRAVTKAIEEHKQKILEVEAQLADLRAEEARLVEQTTVTWRHMQDLSERFGINTEALGLGFQQGRLGASAQELIDALEVFRRGGADMGTVLFGMRDEFSQLVRESIRFGTTIPENLRPVIEHLFETGNLLDENGEKMRDISQIRWGDAMASQLETASDRLAEVADQIARLVDELARLNGTHVSFSVEGNVDNPGFMGEYSPEPVDAAFDVGTKGRTGSYFVNFGKATRAMLHGVEAVITPQQAPGFARAVMERMGAGEPQAPLYVVMDGQVAAQAMVRYAGHQLSLVGAR